MSYVALNPSYYQMLQPESAWHAGAPGWAEAPYPGWGENPNLVGPKRLAVEGLGDEVVCDCTPDRANGALFGMVLGGIGGSLAVYLLTR